ncbi:MAG: NADH-quinone oxidoreductase subunit C [Bacteroidetes bacterium]|nr:MAG: NADH-quinone oxidoreductase subunit C [Bacteroidota bacterium]REK03430.1 MAG: NADH-quinone oxidoreductase subunit C [Bacteroidota bacterium]REK34458.1 MAG: NADH-quinone oxidoreductase subunit C [Bacteroidota bacterium]REK50423.1 MAG: NADH-quinone oxidoreductase subunit C [Bacteroidota bacterium]
MEQSPIEKVIEKISASFGDKVLSQKKEYDFHIVEVERDILHSLVKFLYDDAEHPFRFLTTLCGVHYPANEKPYTLMVQLHCLTQNLRIRLKASSGEKEPHFDSLTDIFPAANWMEREAYDFYGFKFKGHPNLKRILNVDDMDYFPMRKEYPVEDLTRYDKDDTMFGRDSSKFDRKKLMEKKKF